MGTKWLTEPSRNAAALVAVACACALSTPGCGDNEASDSCTIDGAPLGTPAELVWGVNVPCFTVNNTVTCPEPATFAWSAARGAQRITTGTPRSQSPDGKWIEVHTTNGYVIVSAVDGTCRTTRGDVLDWSKDSRRAVVAGYSEHLDAIDLASGTTMHSFSREFHDSVGVFGWLPGLVSPDGEWLAAVLQRAPRNSDGLAQPSETPDALAFARLDGTEVHEAPMLDSATGSPARWAIQVTGWTSDSAYAVVAGFPNSDDVLVGREDNSVVILERDPLDAAAGASPANVHALPSPVRPELAVFRSSGVIDVRQADGSSNRRLVSSTEVSGPVPQHFSTDGVLLAFTATRTTTPAARVVDTATGEVIHAASSVDLSFDGWIVSDGTDFSRTSAPGTVVHQAPAAVEAWVRRNRYAYLENRRLHVAAIDGSEDEVIWEVASHTDRRNAEVRVLPQRVISSWP